MHLSIPSWGREERTNNMKITEYTTKQGTRYQVSGYLGLDEATGRQKNFKRKGFKTKKEAQNSFTRAKHEFNTGCYSAQSKTLTYEQVYLEWWEQYKLDVKESTQITAKSRIATHILPMLGKHKIDKITPAVFQHVLNQWYTTVKHYKQIYHYACRVLTYALQQGYIKEHPKHRIVMPKIKDIKKNKNKTFYTKEELFHVLTALEKDSKRMWYTLFRVLAFTGMRKGEALALTWQDIDFTKCKISISKTIANGLNKTRVITTPKTIASNRVIAIDDVTLNILKRWRTEQARLLIALGHKGIRGDQLIFSRIQTNSILNPCYPSQVLKHVCNLNKLPLIKIHGFRHTHCSLLFEAGVPMKDVKERLGHADIQTTMNIYTHVTPDSKDLSAQLFANYVNF